MSDYEIAKAEQYEDARAEGRTVSDETIMPMSMKYIRGYYRVPAKRGREIKFQGAPYVIVGVRDQYLRARPLLPDGTPCDAEIATLHPTWRIDYLDGQGER